MNWIELFIFEVVGNKYKIIYTGTEPITVNISTKLIGINEVESTIRFNFKQKNMWFIPSLDYRGCSFISFRNQQTGEFLFDKLIDKNLSDGAKSQNIICLGLNKAGTTSFSVGMQKLGFKKFPEPYQFQYIQTETYHGDFGKLFSILENPKFNLFNDKPFSFPKIYEKIYMQRPNDIYVLTLRENAKVWAKSVMKFWDCLKNNDFRMDKSYINTRFSDDSSRYLINFLEPMFESWGLNSMENLEEKLIKIYDKHFEDCVSFFKDKKNFYVVEIEKEGELKKLATWLGIETTEQNFPWENKNSIV